MVNRELRYFSGLDRFDSSPGRCSPQLPDEPGPAHAVLLSSWQRAPRQYEIETNPAGYWDALCGKAVKVLLHTRFDVGDPDACPACVSHVLSETRTYRRPRWRTEGETSPEFDSLAETVQLFAQLAYLSPSEAEEESA